MNKFLFILLFIGLSLGNIALQYAIGDSAENLTLGGIIGLSGAAAVYEVFIAWICIWLYKEAYTNEHNYW